MENPDMSHSIINTYGLHESRSEEGGLSTRMACTKAAQKEEVGFSFFEGLCAHARWYT